MVWQRRPLSRPRAAAARWTQHPEVQNRLAGCSRADAKLLAFACDAPQSPAHPSLSSCCAWMQVPATARAATWKMSLVSLACCLKRRSASAGLLGSRHLFSRELLDLT